MMSDGYTYRAINWDQDFRIIRTAFGGESVVVELSPGDSTRYRIFMRMVPPEMYDYVGGHVRESEDVASAVLVGSGFEGDRCFYVAYGRDSEARFVTRHNPKTIRGVEGTPSNVFTSRAVLAAVDHTFNFKRRQPSVFAGEFDPRDYLD
jgi:hypothetical protein